MWWMSACKRKQDETVPVYCDRVIREAEDTILTHKLLKAVGPLLESLPEVNRVNDVVADMATCEYAEAVEVLRQFLNPWKGTPEYDAILSAWLAVESQR